MPQQQKCPGCGRRLPRVGKLRVDRTRIFVRKNGTKGHPIVGVCPGCAERDPKRFGQNFFEVIP